MLGRIEEEGETEEMTGCAFVWLIKREKRNIFKSLSSFVKIEGYFICFIVDNKWLSLL